MNEQEQDRFEAELRRTKPARPPEQFIARLRAAKPCVERALRERLQPAAAMPQWLADWRWLASALAVAVAGLLLVRASLRPEGVAKKGTSGRAYGLKADNVQVDQQLVTSYDVVAKLPSGEPVRFHCQKWNDQVVVTDTNGDTVIEQNSPRVEVVPVRIETY